MTLIGMYAVFSLIKSILSIGYIVETSKGVENTIIVLSFISNLINIFICVGLLLWTFVSLGGG